MSKMSGKDKRTMSSKLSTAKKPTGSRVKHDTYQTSSQIFTRFVGKLHVSPNQQLQLTLGTYNAERPQKGFSISLDPDPDPIGSVSTQVFVAGTPSRGELILNVANTGVHAVSAEVWQI